MILKYEEAKKSQNGDFLRKIKAAHQRARATLDVGDTKAKIRSLIHKFESRKRRVLFFKALYPILAYFERFGNADRIGQAFGVALPQILNEDSVRMIGSADSY